MLTQKYLNVINKDILVKHEYLESVKCSQENIESIYIWVYH